MTVTVENELTIIEEATAILLEKMPACKGARLLATLELGTGDYVKMRDQLFAGETVDTLLDQAKAAEQVQTTRPCSMKITEDVRKYAAEQAISEKDALNKGMEEKSKEFVERGADVYAKA